MIQQIVENVLKRNDWSSIEFYTPTSRRSISSYEEYEIDSFALYIKHSTYNVVDVLDLSKIESIEIKTKKEDGSTNDVPFYRWED